MVLLWNYTVLVDGCGRCSYQHDDATWILTSAFIVFTMQSGFGLLESGSVTAKNQVSIMVKNAIDVIVGGLSYWAFGYSFSFGEYSNFFSGWGNMFVSARDEELEGEIEAQFFFHASFATMATTIVSGAMAERTKQEAYIVFSFFNTFIFCFPSHWLWAEDGWLSQKGVIDIAGAGPVHLCGGITGLVATLMLRPRQGRFHPRVKGAAFASARDIMPMGCPADAILGMFMLWWGWLGFNCGAIFGISGTRWRLAARSATATFCAPIAGGIAALTISYVFKKKKFDVQYLIIGVLSALVSITAFCALSQPWEAFLIGLVGACLALGTSKLLEMYGVDDPVGCVGTHAAAGAWGLLSVGLFAKEDPLRYHLGEHAAKHNGFFYGGGFELLSVQLMAIATIASWAAVSSFVILMIIEQTVGLRLRLDQELLGCDIVNHSIGPVLYDKENGEIIQTPHGPDVNELMDDLYALYAATSAGSSSSVEIRKRMKEEIQSGPRFLKSLFGRRQRKDSESTQSVRDPDNFKQQGGYDDVTVVSNLNNNNSVDRNGHKTQSQSNRTADLVGSQSWNRRKEKNQKNNRIVLRRGYYVASIGSRNSINAIRRRYNARKMHKKNDETVLHQRNNASGHQRSNETVLRPMNHASSAHQRNNETMLRQRNNASSVRQRKNTAAANDERSNILNDQLKQSDWSDSSSSVDITYADFFPASCHSNDFVEEETDFRETYSVNRDMEAKDEQNNENNAAISKACSSCGFCLLKSLNQAQEKTDNVPPCPENADILITHL